MVEINAQAELEENNKSMRARSIEENPKLYNLKMLLVFDFQQAIKE